jgi:sialate O-acetylesterase
MSTRYPTNAVSWSEAVCDSVNRHQLMRVGPWRNCSAESLSGFSAVAYHFAKSLADSLQVPIGVICNAVGGTTTESWIDRSTLEKDFPAILRDWYHGDFGMKWARERALQNIANSKNPLQQHPYAPAYMFETAMTPLLGYTLKGIVWYQGESNAHNIELHERLFPLLEKSWRNFFQQKKMPFYFVQLSSLNRRSWPRFRDSQRRMALGLEHTWMTVTSDLGDSLDVHYTNKKPVGERLAMQVLHHSYGHDIVSEGPVIERVESVDGGLLLTFSNTKELHFMGNRLIGFELAGADGIYHEAQATIENGYQVRVSCGLVVAHPVSVRYGWQPFTRANLVNEKGLPCSTFETAERRF